MRRGSIIGPILLILIGGLFLLNNLRPELSVMQMVGDFWPFLLIGWGMVRIIEITAWRFMDKPIPVNGISGGEWTLIVFVCVIGSGIFYASHYRDRWSPRINVHGLEILGDNYDFTYPEQKVKAGKTPRVVIENWRGNARIQGADTEEIRVTGHSSVRAYSQTDADRTQKECALEVVQQSGEFVVRTNQDRAGRSSRISADLEITVPRGATVEARGRHGDFDITDVAGDVGVDSDNAGVRISNAGGNVKVQARRSDVIRAVNVKGNVEVRGSGSDVEIDTVEGQALINGSYTGELMFRKLAKPVRFESSSTQLRVERVPGHIQMSRGDLSANDLVGPIYLKGRSKDVELSNFSNALDISVDRGDIELRPGRIPLSKIDASTRAGDVQIALPAQARFELRATTNRGEIDNSYGEPLRRSDAGKGTTIEGKVGTGPAISLHTDRGRIIVHKGGEGSPAEPATPGAAPKAPEAPKAPKPPSVTTL